MWRGVPRGLDKDKVRAGVPRSTKRDRHLCLSSQPALFRVNLLLTSAFPTTPRRNCRVGAESQIQTPKLRGCLCSLSRVSAQARNSSPSMMSNDVQRSEAKHISASGHWLRTALKNSAFIRTVGLPSSVWSCCEKSVFPQAVPDLRQSRTKAHILQDG